MSKKKMSLEDIKKEAIFNGVDYLRQSHGIDMGVEQFNSYLDSKKINSFISKIENNENFKRFNLSEKAEFLEKNIQQYILDYMPFNESGKNILKSSLESIAGKSVFFSTKKGKEKRIKGALSKKELANRLSYEISKNPQVYANEMPELVFAAKESNRGKLYGSIADIFYGFGGISKDIYSQVKSRTQMYAEKVLEMAEQGLKNYALGKDIQKDYKVAKMEDYIPKKAVASIFGLFGFGLIVASGLRLTGNVIGGVSNLGTGLIGGLFLLIAFGLFLRKK